MSIEKDQADTSPSFLSARNQSHSTPTSQERIKLLFEGVLGRDGTEAEIVKWSAILDNGADFHALMKAFTNTLEFKNRTRVKTAWSPGHFYSPVVDPLEVVEYVKSRHSARPDDIHGINFDVTSMLEFWNKHQKFISTTPFRREASEGLRYSWAQSPYPIGDAVTYRAMINHLRPSRIIEVGSGYSTACSLDTLDEIGLTHTKLTCIEPYPAALQRKLRPGDEQRVTIIESKVQEVDLRLFEELEENDILFIDSTHVLKTGSDVHFEFFDVLPALKAGVVTHFHDIRWPFEYPANFIFERNFSWNEAYGLRAFLMYNNRFSILFYNSLFSILHEGLITETFSDFMINPGSSIWLRVNPASV